MSMIYQKVQLNAEQYHRFCVCQIMIHTQDKRCWYRPKVNISNMLLVKVAFQSSRIGHKGWCSQPGIDVFTWSSTFHLVNNGNKATFTHIVQTNTIHSVVCRVSTFTKLGILPPFWVFIFVWDQKVKSGNMFPQWDTWSRMWVDMAWLGVYSWHGFGYTQ